LVNEPELIVPFTIPISSTVNEPSLIALLKLNVIVLAAPNLGGKHSNVAITVAANSFTDVTGNTNTTIAKNTTKISNLKELIDINTDLTHWDVSHVPFTIPISSTVNEPSLIALLKLNVIVLAAVFAPPLPVIIRVGLIASSTRLPLAIILVNKLAV
jgi:hypothetical protein